MITVLHNLQYNVHWSQHFIIVQNLYNNSVTLFGHCPLILGPISTRSVPFLIKTEGESFDPGFVAIGLSTENSLQTAILTTGSSESTWNSLGLRNMSTACPSCLSQIQHYPVVTTVGERRKLKLQNFKKKLLGFTPDSRLPIQINVSLGGFRVYPWGLTLNSGAISLVLAIVSYGIIGVQYCDIHTL